MRTVKCGWSSMSFIKTALNAGFMLQRTCSHSFLLSVQEEAKPFGMTALYLD